MAVANVLLKLTSLLLLGVSIFMEKAKGNKNCSEGKLEGVPLEYCELGFAWNCSYRSLKEVPSVFPSSNLTRRLCFLDLSWNDLTIIHNNAFAFKELKDLKWLSLNQNSISNIEPLAFLSLSQLNYLNLSCNHLHQPRSISTQVFKPLENLEYLNLKNNSMITYDGLDELLQPLTKLEGLYLSGCYQCSFAEGFERLPNLTLLSLSGPLYSDEPICNISTLLNETFVHLPGLERLYLSFCYIDSVEPGALSPLKNILTLDISYNAGLTFSGMRNVLTGLVDSPIFILDVSAIHERFERGTLLRKEDVEPIQYLKNLKVLYLRLNKLEVIDERVFDLIPDSTSHFWLSGNRLTYGKYVEHVSDMKYMVTMDLSRQHLNFDPFLQTHQDHSQAPPSRTDMVIKRRWTGSLELSRFKIEDFLPYESLEDNFDFCKMGEAMNDNKDAVDKKITEGEDYNFSISCGLCIYFCPPSLTCVCAPEKLSNLNWRASYVYVHIQAFKICSPNSLRTLNLSFNLLEEWHGPIYGLEELHDLNMAENICYNMSSHFFDYFYDLERLNVSFNYLGPSLDPSLSDAGTHFKNLKKLKVLDLTNNGIEGLTANLFEGMENLQYLYLGRNLLTQWNSTLNTKCLRELDLSDNKLESLSETFRNYLDETASLSPDESCNRTDDLFLKLRGNPIQCNCDNRPFLRWLMNSPVNVSFWNTDECHLTDGRRVKLSDHKVIPQIVNRLDTECVPYVWIGISVGTFVMSLVVCVVVYRYRWKLRHLYYSRRQRHRHTGYSRLFERDAFISYAKTEALFIKDKLIPSLEDDHGLRVWVADRDSLAGASIAENLTHAIYFSKKSVLILSKRYFAESWCNYEMNMARIESIESQRRLIIVVLYEDASAKEIPLDYLRLLKTVPCIDYPKHPQHQDTFWASLAEAIQET